MSKRQDTIRTAALRAVVPQTEAERGPTSLFCGHCGAQPEWLRSSGVDSRVCGSCGLGLVLECDADAAPSPGGAFVVLDSSLSVCAVSAGAETLLATCETDAVNHHITELVVPADAEAQGPQNLAAAITWAASGDPVTRKVMVRPANTFGVLLSARISSCGPPRAALVVFD